jgi:hypothetical protein
MPTKRGRKPREDESDYDGEDELDKDDDDDIDFIGNEKKALPDAASAQDGNKDIDPAMDTNGHSDDSTKQDNQDDSTKKCENGLLTQSLITPRELPLQRRIRVRMYFSGGSFYGSPAAYVAYRLSTQLHFRQLGDLLWLACVGVTDAYQHSRLDVAGYTTLAMDLCRQCYRLFPNDMYHRVGNTVYAEQLSGGSNQNGTQQTKIGDSDNGTTLS